jgi:hypothetical protein
MRANSLPLTSAIAAVVAASALVLAPAEVARPTPLGHVCVVMGPRTTCRSTGDVEIHRTATPVVGFRTTARYCSAAGRASWVTATRRLTDASHVRSERVHR